MKYVRISNLLGLSRSHTWLVGMPALACWALLCLSTVSSARQWTDVTGKHKFEANLVRVSADRSVATMVGADGNRYEIPLSALCRSDRDFAIGFAEAANRKAQQKAALEDKKSTDGGKTWTNVPEQVLFEMKEEAIRRFPGDKDRQFEFINVSVDDYLGLSKPIPKQVAGTSVSNKKALSPRGEILTEHVGADSIQENVPTAVVEMLKTQAQTRWPSNRIKQNELVKKQLGYYYVLQNFETPELPELAVVQLKYKAAKLAPTDYKVQLRYVYDQVLAGIEYMTEDSANN